MTTEPKRTVTFTLQRTASRLLPWRYKLRGHCDECDHTTKWTLSQRTAKTHIWDHVIAEHGKEGD